MMLCVISLTVWGMLRLGIPGVVGTIPGDLQANSDLTLPLQNVHHECALFALPQQHLPILIAPLGQARPQHTSQMILQ